MEKRLEDFTPQAIADEAARLIGSLGRDRGEAAYRRWYGALKRECFERLVATMDPTGEVAEWTRAMAAITAKGWAPAMHGVTYSWAACLAVARHGEEPRAEHTHDGHTWPEVFTDADIERALKWRRTLQAPIGFTLIQTEG